MEQSHVETKNIKLTNGTEVKVGFADWQDTTQGKKALLYLIDLLMLIPEHVMPSEQLNDSIDACVTRAKMRAMSGRDSVPASGHLLWASVVER